MTLQKPEETGKKEDPTARHRGRWRQRNDKFHSRVGQEGRLTRMGGDGSRKGLKSMPQFKTAELGKKTNKRTSLVTAL